VFELGLGGDGRHGCAGSLDGGLRRAAPRMLFDGGDL
jgi:hypothetical protein